MTDTIKNYSFDENELNKDENSNNHSESNQNNGSHNNVASNQNNNQHNNFVSNQNNNQHNNFVSNQNNNQHNNVASNQNNNQHNNFVSNQNNASHNNVGSNQQINSGFNQNHNSQNNQSFAAKHHNPQNNVSSAQNNNNSESNHKHYQNNNVGSTQNSDFNKNVDSYQHMSSHSEVQANPNVDVDSKYEANEKNNSYSEVHTTQNMNLDSKLETDKEIDSNSGVQPIQNDVDSNHSNDSDSDYELNQHNVDAIAKIKVVGVGGGGNNTIHSMIKEGIGGVEFIVANTDKQVLNSSIANKVIQLGTSAKGLGAGAVPEEGKKAALETEEIIKNTLEGADMVIVAAGMGGGTGTGAAPEIARIAKEMGALTIGVVTTPFSFEGSQRSNNADYGLDGMRKNTDSLIIVSNEKLLKQFGGISLKDSFIYADKTLKQTIRTITDLIAVPALINLDFADVTTVMKDKGRGLIGIGRATGEDRAAKAAIHAISSPILEASMKGASHAIINISGGDLTLDEANIAVETIKQAAGSELNIIFGVSIVESLGNDIQVSVIATGLNDAKELSEEEIKDEAKKAVAELDIDFDNMSTREILLMDTLPEDEKMTITDELDLQGTPFDIDDEDDDDLPAFLR